jgi:hypothetical protein
MCDVKMGFFGLEIKNLPPRMECTFLKTVWRVFSTSPHNLAVFCCVRDEFPVARRLCQIWVWRVQTVR